MKKIITNLFFEKFLNIIEQNKKNLFWKTIPKKDDLLKNSIIVNVSNILNTVSHLPAEDFLKKKLTVNEFGIPDLSIYIGPNNINIDLISECITHALSYYEKRLTDVSIKIDENNETISNKVLVLTAKIKGTNEIEKFAFKDFVKS